MESIPKATDWHHWFYLHRNDVPKPLKSAIAQKLGISQPDFSRRFDVDRYKPAISEEELRITAEMWNQPVTYVRRKLNRRAA